MTILRINDPHDVVGGLDLVDGDGDWLTVQGRFGPGRDGAYFTGMSDDNNRRVSVVVPLADLVPLNGRLGEFIEHQTNDVGGVVPGSFEYSDFDGDRVLVVSRHNRPTGGAHIVLSNAARSQVLTVTVRIEDLSVVHQKVSSVINEQQEAGE